MHIYLNPLYVYINDYFQREPLLGMSNTPLARIAPAEYADADFQPRVAKSGLDLPSARLIRTQ